MRAARKIKQPQPARCPCGADVAPLSRERIAADLEESLLGAGRGSAESGVPKGSPYYAFGYLAGGVAGAISQLRELCGGCRDSLQRDLLEKGRLL